MSQRPTGGREMGEGTSGSSTAAAAAISAAPAAVSRQQQDNNNCFLLLSTGQIESVEFIPSVPNVYCKYCFVFGPDWRQVGGPEEGISATGHRPSGSNRVVLNTPVEATFASTNPFKWPQIVFSFYGQDAFGNDVIRGYSATHLPTVPGRTKRKCPVFIPQASTAIQRWLGLFTGRRAEFVDARIAAMSEGREVTRVSTLGFVELSLTAVLRDTKKFGYDMSAQTTVKFSEFPLNWPASTSSTSVGIASASFAAAETSQAFEQRRPRFGDGGRERAGAGIETIQESEEEVHGQPATAHHHQHRQQEAVQVETTQVEEFDQS